MSNELVFKVLRTKIDQLDSKILSLLLERFSVVDEISKIKKHTGKPALDEKRFNDIILQLKDTAKNSDLSDNFIEDIWHRIHVEALMRQK